MSFVRIVVRRHGAFAVVLLALAALYAWLTGYDGLGAAAGDGLIYLNTARHYAPYWPADPIAATWAGLTLFPPGYPALLAATGGAASLLLAHAVTTLCLLAAFAAGYAWMVSLGLARARAAAATLLVGLAPGTFLQALYLHPEGLYVALAFGALIALAPSGAPPGAARWWLASVAVAAAILTRTVAVSLLPAFALALRRSPRRAWLALLALAVVPGLAWSVLHRPAWSYTDVLMENYAGVPLDVVVARVGASAAAAVSGLAANLAQPESHPAVVLVLLVAAGAAALWRWRRGQPDAWYVAAYAAVLAIWPYPQEAQRLTWVMLPLVAGYVVWAGERLAALAPGRARAALAWAAPAALALVVLPEFALLMERATHPLARAQPAYRHHPEWYAAPLPEALVATELRLGVAQALARFAAKVPPDECVFATAPFLFAGFYLPRDLRPAPAAALDDAAFAAEVERAGCRYFLFTVYVDERLGFSQPMYPLERVRPQVTIVDQQRIAPADGPPVAALGVRRPDRAPQAGPGAAQ